MGLPKGFGVVRLGQEEENTFLLSLALLSLSKGQSFASASSAELGQERSSAQ